MTDKNYGIARDPEKLDVLIDKLIESGKPIGFDIESGYTGEDKAGTALLTFHPDWILVGISFTNSTEWARYVPIAHDNGLNMDSVAAARIFWKMLNARDSNGQPLGVAHNAPFEMNGLSRWFRETLSDDPIYGQAVREQDGYFPVLSDTLIEAFMVQEYDPIRVGLGLKGLTKHCFGHQMVEFLDLFKDDTAKAKMKYVRFNTRELTPQVVNYACEDSVWCLSLHQKHYNLVKDMLVFKTEMQLQQVLCEMEREGLALDWAEYERRQVDTKVFQAAMNEEIQSDLSELTGELVNINLGSPKQVGEMLYEKLGYPVKTRTDTGAASTSEKALRAIAKDSVVIQNILKLREVGALLSRYITKYLNELRYAEDGRAHANHKQTGTVTGRLSVDGVSYQQWPKPYHYELKNGMTYDMNYRDFLISPPEHRIIGYDYSQVELRILAGMANETALLEAFAAGVDIHKATASNMMKIPLEEVTKKQRSQGKTLNFAVVYGSGAANIGELLGIPTEEAQELLDTYFATFSKLKGWMDEQKRIGRATGIVTTKFGRKFRVWDYMSSESWIQAKGDRMAVNAPVQGGAADYIKIAMVRVNKAIKKAGMQDKIKLFMTVHDALEFYVHDSVSTQYVIDLIQPCVSYAVSGLPEIRADWHEGYKWGSVAEIKVDDDKQITHYELDDVDEKFYKVEDAYAYIAKKNSEEAALAKPDAVVVDSNVGTPEWSEAIGKVLDARNAERGFVDDDEPEWAHSPKLELDPQTIVLTLSKMPTKENWPKFLAFSKSRPGRDTIVLSTPQGDITLDNTYSITPADQPFLSLMFNGCVISKLVTADENLDDILEGLEL